MKNDYYSSLNRSMFCDWGWDLIFHWMLSLPYSSILNMAHTCKYMHTVCHQAAERKEYLIKEKAVQNINEELFNLGYLKKIEELSVKYPIAIGGDFVLSKITSLDFDSEYIDLYIGNPRPYNESPITQFLWTLFKLNPKDDSEFIMLKQNSKFGQTTFHIGLNMPQCYAKTLCIHLVQGASIEKYIESKFDLTPSMIWFDLHKICTSSTNRFWQQVCGIGYINNDYFLHDTGDRLMRWWCRSQFRIINDYDFNWDVYHHEESNNHDDDDSFDIGNYSDEGQPNYYNSDS